MMAEQENWQEMYTQFQHLQEQIERITEHAELLNQRHAELDISINAMQELGKTELETEILSPIANGIFLKSALKDNKTLIVNVGADTTVERTIDEVVDLLEKQKKEIAANIVEAEEVLHELHSQAQKIYNVIENK